MCFSDGIPTQSEASVPERRRVQMPTSSSFPSGRAASGFAFAEAVGVVHPAIAMPPLLATVVGYHECTRRALSGDVFAGALIGSSIARPWASDPLDPGPTYAHDRPQGSIRPRERPRPGRSPTGADLPHADRWSPGRSTDASAPAGSHAGHVGDVASEGGDGRWDQRCTGRPKSPTTGSGAERVHRGARGRHRGRGCVVEMTWIGSRHDHP